MSARRDAIRRLHALQRKLVAEAGAAVDSPADEPRLAASLAVLAHINQLIDTQSAIHRRHQRHGLVLLLIGVTLAIAAASLYRMSGRLDWKVVASAVQLQSRTQQRLTALLPVDEVVLADTAVLEGPAELGLRAGAVSQLTLTGMGAPIHMEPLTIEPGDRVSLEVTGRPNQYRLVLQANHAITVSFSLLGKVAAQADGARRERGFDVPREVVAQWPAKTPAVITFSSREPILTRPIAIQALDFRSDEFVMGARVPVSTLVSGDISFPEYERTVALKDRDLVTSEGIQGHVRGIVAQPSSLAVTYQGTVTNLLIGEGAARETEMPTLLDYLTKQRERVTIVSTIGALIAVIVTCWNWWRDSA
jgi:hypothetical protein